MSAQLFVGLGKRELFLTVYNRESNNVKYRKRDIVHCYSSETTNPSRQMRIAPVPAGTF